MSAEIRNYTPRDFKAIQRIHDQNGIDYRLPDLSRFPIIKTLEAEGVVRAAYGLQTTLEAHLFLDRSNWTDAEGRWLAIKALDREATEAAANLAVTSVLCCIPPGYERFGRRIKELGFSPVRDGWKIFTKQAGDKQCA